MYLTINNIRYPSWIAAAAAHGICEATFLARVYQRHWDRARAATEPLQRQPKFFLYEGKMRSVREIADMKGVHINTIQKRIQREIDLDQKIIPRERGLPDEEYVRRRKVRQAATAKENAAKIRHYKSIRPCRDCKKIFDPDAMEFDHARGVKRFEISKAGKKSLRAIATEIAKCDLVCANCHRLRTKNRRLQT